MRYLVTFACYGNRLHGDEAGSIDREHNVPGTRLAEADPERFAHMRREMPFAPYVIDNVRRMAVLAAIEEVCVQSGWVLLASHVRTNHVHAVVEGEARPERIMNAFKAYASRRLNAVVDEQPNRKRWARQGSTRWLWNDRDVRAAVRYVVEGQGEPIAVFVAEEFR